MSMRDASSTGLGLDHDYSSTGSSSSITYTSTDSDFASRRRAQTLPARTGSHATMRSASAMHGLLLAEVGGSMVQLDEGGTGFREGPRIALDLMTPGGGLRPDTHTAPHEQTFLSRHGTLLSANAPPGRTAAELKSLLGNAHSRLKPGAFILPNSDSSAMEMGQAQTSLEQAKPRARVEVDIILQSNTCVQGGYLKGHIKIRIRKQAKNQSAVLISNGKIRVVGFECIPNDDDRHVFYQHSALLCSVTTSSMSIFTSPPDTEGFAGVREGVHNLKFAMHIPLDGGTSPKGVLHVHSGVTVRYLAMISVKVKDSETGKRSIAHFYRDCEIWPRLNPSVALAPADQPLLATTSKSLFMGGNGKVKVTATMHRLNWIAGQQCFVDVSVTNGTKKTIKSFSLTLLRSTVIFRPDPDLDIVPASRGLTPDPDACQASTTQKQVAQTTLEMAHGVARGHASTKGWWTGVSPGESLKFSHSLLLPPDALTFPRARLLEVEYTIRASLSAGSLTSNIHVTLPIKIFNFLSIDPPPSAPPLDMDDVSGTLMPIPPPYQNHRPNVNGLFGSYGAHSRVLETQSESDSEKRVSPALDYAYDQDCIDDDAYAGLADEESSSVPLELGNLSMYEDDANEIVQHAITSAPMDLNDYSGQATRFSDLYYASIEDLNPVIADLLTEEPQEIEEEQKHVPDIAPQLDASLNTRSRPARPRGPSSFATRVQEKLQAVAVATCASPESDPNINQAQAHEPTGPSSYFDPSANTNVSIINSNCHLPAPPPASAASSDSGYQSNSPNDQLVPLPSSANSSAFTTRTTASAFSVGLPTSGSRLLPVPPSCIATATPPAGDVSVYAVNVPLAEVALLNVPKVPAAAIPNVRPRLAPQGGSSAGSATSVRDKIRELEERVMAVSGL